MKIFAYSKALYSTWLYMEPLRLLLDAGEGLNTFLEGRLLAIRNIAISHAHTDHFTGLQNIFITRLREMEVTGQQIPPIKLFYPSDSETLKRYFQYLEEVTSRWDELVILQPLSVGDSFPLDGVRGLFLTALEADHYVYQQTALSFRIDQERWLLKPEMKELSQTEINKKVAQEGRSALTTRILQPALFFSGDGRVSYDPKSEEVALLIQEATFLESNSQITHTSLPETIELFRRLKAKRLLIYHLSTRFDFRDYLQLLDELVPDEKERSHISLIRPNGMFFKDIPVLGF